MWWCGMIEWMQFWKQIKVKITENAWNNLGQLNWTFYCYVHEESFLKIYPNSWN